MIRFLYSLWLSSLWAYSGSAQDVPKTYTEELEQFQEEINNEFSDTATSPLPKQGIPPFTGLPFLPIDSTYRIEAAFVRTPGQLPFYMPTTSGSRKVYEK